MARRNGDLEIQIVSPSKQNPRLQLNPDSVGYNHESEIKFVHNGLTLTALRRVVMNTLLGADVTHESMKLTTDEWEAFKRVMDNSGDFHLGQSFRNTSEVHFRIRPFFSGIELWWSGQTTIGKNTSIRNSVAMYRCDREHMWSAFEPVASDMLLHKTAWLKPGDYRCGTAEAFHINEIMREITGQTFRMLRPFKK